jgi:hypothetical protein
MTTATTTTRIRHDSDATFREWGLEFQTQLLAIGLVADEKNTNWTTATRPGINTEYGYEVYHLNDSLFGTAPIYIRVGYGTATSTTAPRLQITVGTSTNGSGVLGGAVTASQAIGGVAVQTTDTTRVSRWCAVEGAIAIRWKIGASQTTGFFYVCRTLSVAGTLTTRGALCGWSNNSVNSFNTQALRFAATAQAFTQATALTATALGLNAQSQTSSANIAPDKYAYVPFGAFPEARPVFGVCGLLNGDSPAEGDTLSVALVGATAHTYIVLATTAGPFGNSSAAGPDGIVYAMIWE